MSETSGARVTIARTSTADIGQRQVIVSIDGGPEDHTRVRRERDVRVAPGEHALKANNTLVWKTVPFSAATGEHVQFEIANCATRFTLGFLSLIGVAPLYLKVERLPPT